MARIKRMPRRARPTSDGAATAATDQLSALPDDLLRLILRRLDTRTALSTAVLAKRWARLPRDLPALELRVSDVLPRRYHRAVAALRRNRGRLATDAMLELDALVARCERRAMHAFSDGVAGLLDADEADGDDRRRAKSLRLEFFPTEESSCVDRLIPTAVGAWGVEDLELAARPPHLDLSDYSDGEPAYAFPHHLLDDDLHRSCLRRLTLANCAVPPLYRYTALAELVLRDMPASTPAATYQKLFTARSPLETLRLVSCGCAGKERQRRLVVSAPCSRLKELVVDGCSFLAIELLTLPMLERLACLSNSVELRLGGGIPRLAHVNLSFTRQSSSGHDELGCFLDDVATVSSLAMRFTGARRWIVPRPLETKLRGLRKLLVADVPSSWDVTWTRILLVAAPALEVMHIHVAPSQPGEEPGSEINWPVFKFRHRRLREVALAGFGRTWRQIFFVRYLARVCKEMQRVLLLKDWCVREKGLWDWELVQQQECPWSEEEKMVVRKQVKYGKYWCRPQLQVLVA